MRFPLLILIMVMIIRSNNNDSNYNRAPFHSQISVNKLSTSEDSSLTGTPTFDTKTLMGSDEVCSLFDSIF